MGLCVARRRHGNVGPRHDRVHVVSARATRAHGGHGCTLNGLGHCGGDVVDHDDRYDDAARHPTHPPLRTRTASRGSSVSNASSIAHDSSYRVFCRMAGILDSRGGYPIRVAACWPDLGHDALVKERLVVGDGTDDCRTLPTLPTQTRLPAPLPRAHWVPDAPLESESCERVDHRYRARCLVPGVLLDVDGVAVCRRCDEPRVD